MDRDFSIRYKAEPQIFAMSKDMLMAYFVFRIGKRSNG